VQHMKLCTFIILAAFKFGIMDPIRQITKLKLSPKFQRVRYFVITLNEETLNSGLASDSLLFLNPASSDPVRGDGVVISSCNRRHQLTEAVKGELYIDSLETSTKLTYYHGKN